MSESGRSHPVIRFENVPIIEGPLSRLEAERPSILDRSVTRSIGELAGGESLDLLLSQALYGERIRMKRHPGNIFTRHRIKRDRVLWGGVQRDLMRSPGEVDRRVLLERVLRHYAEEIGGHFDPRVYKLATHGVPWFFSWLLNAASVNRFLPWGMTEALQGRLQILGEVPMLQRLSGRGTILLVPTHQSNIDSVLIGYLIYLMQLPPFAYGAGLNLFSNPALSFFMSRLGAYTVDRLKGNPIYKNVLKNYSTTILRSGMHSIFFPGGGRSRSGAIEDRLKLGLLGTALDAQVENLRDGRPNPNVYVVPMVMSYHFVLEAQSLVEQFLEEHGKHRFLSTGKDESWQPTRIFEFFWKLFSSRAGVIVRIGKPLDVFGNFVDEDGASIGPNGTRIDPRKWLTTRGELRPDPQRDHEYTRELGRRLVSRYHRENTVLSSHAVAYAYFSALRAQYPELDLYRFLRLSDAQRSLPIEKFMAVARELHEKLRKMEKEGALHLSDEFAHGDPEQWILEGARKAGVFHGSAVVKLGSRTVTTEDMNLLYYYRNRLAGYDGTDRVLA